MLLTQKIINDNPQCQYWYNVIIPKDGVYFLHNLKYIEANTTGVTDMKRMFFNCKNKFSGNLDEWDMSSVKDTSYMFAYSGYNGDISKWDTSSITNMKGMFAGSVFNSDISNVSDMGDMFMSSRFNNELPWNVSNVSNMDGMFLNSMFNQDISQWEVNGDINCMMYYSECMEKNKPNKARFTNP